jgi:decaprenylphospho-beta-D-ribofuranose 2-oxidase
MSNLQQVEAFGRYDIGTSHYFAPSNADGVNQVYKMAQSSGGRQRIAIRGGGHSFDGQALHSGDTGTEIILSSKNYDNTRIVFNADGTVTLGGGVPWSAFVAASIQKSQTGGGPILLPGAMETGGAATVAGTLSGGCLSRFSGMLGKESHWVKSLKVLTPSSPTPIACDRNTNPDLFHAVVGGFGYIGFVTEATYKMLEIPAGSIAHTDITTQSTLHDMIQQQLDLINGPQDPPRGVSSAWFTPPNPKAAGVHPAFAAAIQQSGAGFRGGIFNSTWAQPSGAPAFPLYTDLQSASRFATEVAARNPWLNYLIHLGLFELCQFVTAFDDDIPDFLFFMDGDTYARAQYEKLFGQRFPIIQQTYVVPTAVTESFTQASMDKIDAAGLDSTDCDMLYIKADHSLMSANYNLDGFAISWVFEPDDPSKVPPAVDALLQQLSKDCLAVGGRIHLPKNAHIDPTTFRAMFSPQIAAFEGIKRTYDPNKLIQNPFSDKFFEF